jgi:beta-hydroxyacyl-ACP dehydratase FabZ
MTVLDVQEIRDILPHRYPMLLVDRIIELDENRIVGLKNVTVNEPHFTGHFPQLPVMPGVLIIESMAQVAGVWVGKTVPNSRGKLMFLASVEGAKFRKPVVPGDQLHIEMTLEKRKLTVIKMRGIVRVDGQVVAEAMVMCKIIDPTSMGQPAVEVPEPQMA